MNRGRLMTVAAVLGLALTAQAQEPDIRLRDKQETVVRLYVRTKVCMRDAGDAALREHLSRDGRVVQLFMVSFCGDPLRRQMQLDGAPEAEARATLARMARTSYYVDVMRVPEPPYADPNASKE